MSALPISNNRSAFTLVEIMIVVAIIALLASMAIYSYIRARQRSQATLILNNLRLIESAKDQYAVESNKTIAAPVGGDLAAYFKHGRDQSHKSLLLLKFMGPHQTLIMIDDLQIPSATTFGPSIS